LFGGRVSAQYTAQGGFFPNGAIAPLLAMTFALYTSAESKWGYYDRGITRRTRNPSRGQVDVTILAMVYLGAITVLVGVMPWNRVGVTESPFVTIFKKAGIPAQPA